MIDKLPVGTKIIFTKTLESAPNEHSPYFIFANKGDIGVVVAHNCEEGHWVGLYEKDIKPFGAVLNKQFTEYKE